MQRLSNNMHHDRKDELSGGYLEIFIFRGNKCILSSIFTVFRGFLSLKDTDIGNVLIKSFWNDMKFNFKFFNL